MATNQTVKDAPLGAATIDGVAKRLLNLADAYRRWRDARRTVATLRGLSATQLEDIGLTPSDIDSFAARGRF